jgi:hypothetical protein
MGWPDDPFKQRRPSVVSRDGRHCLLQGRSHIKSALFFQLIAAESDPDLVGMERIAALASSPIYVSQFDKSRTLRFSTRL